MTTKRHRPILLGSVAVLSVVGIAVAATTASIPAPETLWKEIGILQKKHAIMPESRPFQAGSRVVDVYTVDLSNRPASETIHKAGKITSVTRYPAGSLLVKENYDQNKKLTGITAMLKVDGYDPGDRNWLMAAYSPAGKVVSYGKVSSCITCHVMVSKTDFVFAPPPFQMLPVSVWKAFFPKQAISPLYRSLLATHPEAVVK